jgi:hypothetical protein
LLAEDAFERTAEVREEDVEGVKKESLVLRIDDCGIISNEH